jgi:guanyl-specific ribonuclease Sa
MLGTIAIGNAAIFSTANQASAVERLNDRMAALVNLKTDSTFLVAKKNQSSNKPPKSGKLPDYAREAFRDIKINPGKGKVYNNAGGSGGTKLPTLSNGEKYVEHDVINPKDKGNRGKYRIVTKVDGNNKLVKAYYTGDHYKTFQELN